MIRHLYPLAVALALTASISAQTFQGEIKGSAADTTGAVIPEAAVKATNKGAGVTRSTSTSSSGDFSIPDLPLGMYFVQITKPGFQSHQSEVEVVVSRVSTLNSKSPIATQSSTVEVSAAVETTSTTLTGVVNTKTVTDLPMNGRDFGRMLKLSPGVNPANSAINGNRTRGNNFQIDGADNNERFQNASAVNQGGVAGTLLPVEAIAQFSVACNGSAEIGRDGGVPGLGAGESRNSH